MTNSWLAQERNGIEGGATVEVILSPSPEPSDVRVLVDPESREGVLTPVECGQKMTAVLHTPRGSGARDSLRGVPDTYSGRLGAAYLLPVLENLVLSVGGRINGVTVRDIVGGGDLYWRRPGYEVYVESGLTLTRSRNTVSFSFPVRAYQKKLDSLLDESLGRHVGSDFAPFLILASYARRF